ncbi:hypothetical protein GALL_535040 [mine drainage metagenome]|uniref:Lipoprotein n=1 Tax=mine drainage metagenome TaxID=410659 RepID=A0A1J5PAV6_9ZZZZ
MVKVQGLKLVLGKKGLCYVMAGFGFACKIFISACNNAQQG